MSITTNKKRMATTTMKTQVWKRIVVYACNTLQNTLYSDDNDERKDDFGLSVCCRCRRGGGVVDNDDLVVKQFY